MNEAFQLRLRRNGRTWPIDAFGGHGIVGANVPIGTGLAFANRYRQNGAVSVTYFGDGAARHGRQQDTSKRVAERQSEAALQRFDLEFGEVLILLQDLYLCIELFEHILF